MAKWTERVVDTVLVVTCVAMLAVFSRRNSNNEPSANGLLRQELVANWKQLLPATLLFGSKSADVTIVEFADLECPFCARFSTMVDSVRARYPDRVALAFMHYPLQQHRFATDAAKALECADQQNKAEELMKMIYAQQDSLGKMTWKDFGAAVKVPSQNKFTACIESQQSFPRIAQGMEWGKRLQIKGTPTVLVNGWLVLANSHMGDAVDSIMQGKPPYSTYKTITF